MKVTVIIFGIGRKPLNGFKGEGKVKIQMIEMS